MELTNANSALKPLKQAASVIAEKYKKFEETLTKLLDNLKNEKEKVGGLSELQRYFVDFSSYIKQNFQALNPTPAVRTISSADKQ